VNRRSAVLSLAFALLAAGPALGSETYTVTELPIVDGDAFATGYLVNAHGQVALTSNPSATALLWQQGVVESTSPLPGDTHVNVTGLTSDGRMAVWSYDDMGNFHGFVYDHGTQIPLESALPGGIIQTGLMNDAGLVAGLSQLASDARATIWDNGVPVALEGPDGFPYTLALAINEAGVVPGLAVDLGSGTSRVCLWTTTSIVDLGAWPDHFAVIPFDIDESNDFVGYTQGVAGIVPFRCVGGVFEELPLPDGYDRGYAFAMNEKGQIVGSCLSTTTSESTGVIWEDGVPTDLSTLLEPGSTLVMNGAVSINDRGQITGQGWFDSETLRAFLLTPKVDALAGNVNVQNGPPANVLFVNGSYGDEANRTVTLAADEAIQISMDTTPSRPAGNTRFVLYAFVTAPNAATERDIALLSIGRTAMPMPLSEASPKLKRTWNNIGHHELLGAPDFPSSPAPSTVLSKPSGVGRAGTFTFQGLILDPMASNGLVAVTNGIVLQVH